MSRSRFKPFDRGPLGALSRVGVSFSHHDQVRIQAYMEAGDRVAAQRLIVSLLNREFHGPSIRLTIGRDGVKRIVARVR